LVGADFTGASLQYRDFSGVDFHDAIFVNANLLGSKFTGVNMRSAQLGGAKIKSLDFHGLDFTGAKFVVSTRSVVTDATGANFSGVNFSNAIFDMHTSSGGGTWMDITNANFQNANFSGATIKGLFAGTGPSFVGANFTGATLSTGFPDSTDIHGVDFRTFASLGGNVSFGVHSNLSGTNWSGLTLGVAAFYTSNLTSANFSNTVLNGSQFGEGDNMTGANFTNAQFNDAFLAGTDFSGVALTGATWSNTLCPDQTNSDANGGTCVGHLVP